MHVGHAEHRQDREHHDAHPAAEVASVHADEELRDGGHRRRPARAAHHAAEATRERGAEREEGRGEEEQPRNQLDERGLGGVQEQERACRAPREAGDREGRELVSDTAQLAAVGEGARDAPRPEGDGIRGVRGDGGDAGKEEGGKGDEAASPRDGVDPAAERRREEQHDGRRHGQGCPMSV